MVPPASKGSFDFSEEAPAWLRDNVRVLTDMDLGCHYRALVETWIRLEERFGFDENPRSGLSKAARPTAVTEWIGSGRGLRKKGPYDAGVTNLDAYAKEWQGWWDSLQPKWRTRLEDGTWERPEEYSKKWDWDELWFPGQNGCASIVASLYFWGSAKQALGGAGGWNEKNQSLWEQALHDVVWMIEGLEQAVPAPKKSRRRR
ncbi:hypothetical protein C8R43DRAFT_881334 [Mycena crocata]|nr:hypothetical protein C8R43DRAFT_881334 [Mycena crocata]